MFISFLELVGLSPFVVVSGGGEIGKGGVILVGAVAAAPTRNRPIRRILLSSVVTVRFSLLGGLRLSGGS